MKIILRTLCGCTQMRDHPGEQPPPELHVPLTPLHWNPDVFLPEHLPESLPKKPNRRIFKLVGMQRSIYVRETFYFYVEQE